MPISPELQAKIDALDDEELRARIIKFLTAPYIKEVSDEEIFDNIVSRHAHAKAYVASLRKWTSEEVMSFVEYMKKIHPDDYHEFIRQEQTYGEIERDTGDSVFKAMFKWMPELSLRDGNVLFGEFRDYIADNFT